MGAAKRKQSMAFPLSQIREWEADDCVNFAIALVRMTGWLIHVDWLSDDPTPDSRRPVEKMTPLRVYVGDDGNRIFDVRGIKTIEDFCQRIIRPLMIERKKPWIQRCGVATRHYSEAELAALPLAAVPDEAKIQDALAAIQAVPGFLTAIPERPWPRLPANEAAKFTWGMCAIYAEALSAETGLEPVGLLVKRFQPLYANTPHSENGYVHSVALHPDGTVEDSWGRAQQQRVADRFGAVEWVLDPDEHRRAATNLERNTPERWRQHYEEALSLIRAFRGTDR